MTFGLINVIGIFKSDYVYVNGLIMFGIGGVGSVYQNGNESVSYVNLTPFIGPWHGNLRNESDNNYNYLTSLIPGEVPSISGPFSSEQEYYSLESLRELTNTTTYFCKILGLGIGNVNEYKVSKVNLNGINGIAENFVSSDFFVQLDFLPSNPVFVNSPFERSASSWSITQTNVYPQTEYGVNFYTNTYDWPNDYGLTQFNGTNTFPTFGFSGVRIGSIDPKTFQIQEDSLFNVPSTLLLNTNFVNIGIIYAGQGVQCCNIPTINAANNISFNKRNQLNRQFEKRLNTRNVMYSNIGIVPYQQGRGIYEYVSREPQYNRNNALISFFNIISTFGPEGAQPGRNHAFLGVVLTDIYSPDLNLNNQTNSSTTPQDTRYTLQRQKQTLSAHNAPLVYSSTVNNNTSNPLPWNSLNGYMGTTNKENSFTRSDNTPILTKGVTVMVTSGAYPLYRGTGFTEYSGFIGGGGGIQRETNFRYFSQYKSQYYVTPEFWNPDNLQTNIPQSSDAQKTYAVAPNPPYRLKGGRIVLYSNQHIINGSYVYITMGNTGNVNISQFYGPSAKEIIIEPSFRNVLLGDLYSKYQSNQGGLIVIVSDSGSETSSEVNNSITCPPNIPPNCVPIGIILENVDGIGSPQEVNTQTEYIHQFNVTTDIQTNPDFENVYQLQNREFMVQLFPMVSQLSTSGISSVYDVTLTPVRTNTATNFLLQNQNVFGTVPTPASPLYAKIRSCYTIPDSKYSYQYVPSNLIEFNFPLGYSRRENELLNDWPGPQSGVL